MESMRTGRWPVGLTAALSLCCGIASAQESKEGGTAMSLRLSSPAFADQRLIPKRYTCDGQEFSPPLAWSGRPQGTQSFALIVDDPDAPDPKAPKTTWVHWVLYNLPNTVSGLPEGMASPPPGARQGLNDWKRADYGGPCPPVGQHRYFHKLYALDTVLPDLRTPTKAQLEQAMRGHILAEARLIGLYQRSP
ncbi:hypothetical protein SAMN02949497_3380 [Methylomagnum ishizawai]|uniref:Phospholipid-binding protein, PBP family n=2 Tax=Methylomagnum ishizawai TaxID=1760988 RepID=A0A1Y6D087_9GAMM|nr:hypothetical protein SAMN02949497_3380 [Methylomagnum ishizawai]